MKRAKKIAICFLMCFCAMIIMFGCTIGGGGSSGMSRRASITSEDQVQVVKEVV